VSARANALALQSPLSPGNLLRSLNGLAPDLFFTAATEIEPRFRVRAAARRRYRYFDRPSNPHLDRWHAAAERFVGEIDVRSFGRGLPTSSPILRRIESVRIREVGGGVEVEVVAPSFVWGMVRKIVAALREVDSGRLSLARLENALDGRERLTLPMAEPEPLVLWDVEYPLAWTYHWRGPNRHQARWWTDRRSEWLQRGQVLDWIRGAVEGEEISRGSER